MELFKLVIVDDEPILLRGLLDTYDWNSMGFEVVGTALSGKQALEVIRRVKPDAVLTDIYMKQITGLMVMEEIHKENRDCLFVVLSAYRDFEYAQQACKLGAFAYLLKPVEDEKLQEVMQGVYNSCMERHKNEEKYENWENFLVKDNDSFLKGAVRKYVLGQISQEKLSDIVGILTETGGAALDRFITVCVDIDLSYKITNSVEYEASRHKLFELLDEKISGQFFCWSFEEKESFHIFIIKTSDNEAVAKLKKILDFARENQKNPITASISKPYEGIDGMKKSFEEASQRFDYDSVSGTADFMALEKSRNTENNRNTENGRNTENSRNTEKGRNTEKSENAEKKSFLNDVERSVVSAVRKNDKKALKEAFISFIYQLPEDEEVQCRFLHRLMLQAEFMVEDTYGMTEDLKDMFRRYYSSYNILSAAKSVDVCYKILMNAIDIRLENREGDEAGYFKGYMEAASSYIEEHLDDEELSIVEVAAHIYLNPVYFGRVFKKTYKMTFKKYLIRRRMEKAKRLLEEGNESIGSICEQVGINAPSYFSHLFKEYTGMLPSEYKKEYEK